MAEVISVNISKEKGVVKTPVPKIKLLVNAGVEGDAHSGNWHRQISLLADESIDKLRDKLPNTALEPGVFAENITTCGIELFTLPVGTRLRVGETEMEITQIGKECHLGCAIRNLTGDCVMPREGVFAIVIREGQIKAGDSIKICSNTAKAEALKAEAAAEAKA